MVKAKAKKEKKEKKVTKKKTQTVKVKKVKVEVKAKKTVKVSVPKVRKPVRKVAKPVAQIITPSKPVVTKPPKIERPHIEPVVVKPAPVAPKPQVPTRPKVVIRPPSPPKEVIPSPAPAISKELEKELELELPINLKDLAVRLQQKPSVLIKELMGMRIMSGINQVLNEEAVTKLCGKFGFKIKKALGQEEAVLQGHQVKDEPLQLKPRYPVVTIMGHVDHGKTSLLDAIRKSKVAEAEHGGITQHIGAYRVVLPQGEITFLDTPGHEAFTAMRGHGARITDVVILVVAADDGVMPQTQEAIDHARAAGVPIVVAINKIDKPQAQIDRVKKQLGELDLLAEDWGGKTITVGVSAKTGQGIPDLLEMMLLEAQMLELKANPNRAARGVVIEAKMAKGKGPVSTLLVQNGTLHLNDMVLTGNFYGKVRAMFDDHGRAVTKAGPSFPVEILGISGIPEAGEQFFVIEDEKVARDLAVKRQEESKEQSAKAVKRISLEDLHAQIKEGKLKELNLVVKADVQGSIAAIHQILDKLNVTEIKLNIIHEGVGAVNPSDVILAVASNALILGFNVDIDDRAKELVVKEGVDARTYNIIYEMGNDIKAALEGMLEPKTKKVFLGRAEVRKVFKLSKSGTIAGCIVSKGKINRNAQADLVRNGEVIFEGKIASLKRFKDDVRDVAEGFECGISLAGFDNYQEGDIIDAYDIEKIARKL